MATRTLSRGGLRIVHRAVDGLFDRLKLRTLGPDAAPRGPKNLYFDARPDLSLPGIYRRAATEEYTKPDEDVLHSLVKTAESYLEAQREHTKALVVQAVNAWLADSAKKKTESTLDTVLGGHLADIWGKMTTAVTKIVDSESTRARNMGTLEGISKISSSAGIDDPAVYFVVVKDTETCAECKRLHLQADERTPRVWRLSEVATGHHLRGQDHPSIAGLHPHCRCTLSIIMPGYGFDVGGSIRFVGFGHDEFRYQRG